MGSAHDLESRLCPGFSGPCVTPICIAAWRSRVLGQRSDRSRIPSLPPRRSVACEAVAGPLGSSESERCETRSSRCFLGASARARWARPGSEQMIKNSVRCQCPSSRDIKVRNPNQLIKRSQRGRRSRRSWAREGAAVVCGWRRMLLRCCHCCCHAATKSETAPRQPNTAFQPADPTLPDRSFSASSVRSASFGSDGGARRRSYSLSPEVPKVISKQGRA